MATFGSALGIGDSRLVMARLIEDTMCHLEAKGKKLAGSEGEAYRDINKMARISDQLLSSGKQQ